MADPSKDTITLVANCLCKANIFKTEVPLSKLPLPAHICHCDSCRHVTGALYTTDIRWPKPRAEVDVSKLKVFHFSPKIDLLFCPTCSTPMFWADPQDRDRLLGVFTGVLANVTENMIKFVDQIFVCDTLDGGASVWMRRLNVNESEVKTFKLGNEAENAEEIPPAWPSPSELTGYEAKREDTIPVRCKCKGVDLVLHRGDYSKLDNESLPFNIDPETHKLLAEFCACDSCRLQSGIDLFYWTFAEMKHISFGNNGKSFPTHSKELQKLVDAKDATIGTLTYYASSPGVERYFCSNCSACIFYACHDRPELVDIAIGVLTASDGARAEGLLSWTYGSKIDFREDGDGGWRQGLFDRVEKNAEEYRVGRGYPKNWKRLAKDSADGKGEQ